MRALLKNTTLRAAVALLAVLGAVCVLSACSGSAGSAESLLNDTFSGAKQIESGDLNLSLSVTAAGSNSGGTPLAVHLSGPFESTQAGKLPRFDLQLDLDAAGHGLRAGATSTGSALFVDLAGTWFSTPESTYKALEQGYSQATKATSSSKLNSTFAALGIEPGHWLSNPVELGDTTIDGTKTIHLAAAVDIHAFLTDVSKLSQNGALGLNSAVPGAATLSTSVISELAKSVKSAHVDVYTGQSDHLLRRLEFVAAVSATPQTQSVLGGMKSANIKLQLEFSALNKPQKISAPPNPKAPSELLPALQQLVGGLSALSGTSGSGGLEPLLGGSTAAKN